MPVNKSFQRRIELMDACLRRRQRAWSRETLREEINEKLQGMGLAPVSVRTLDYDMQELIQLYNAPLESYNLGRKKYFRYTDPDFSIRKLPLRQEDLGFLKDALEVLKQIRGLQLANALGTVISKLENTISCGTECRPAMIQFEQEVLTTGGQWLDGIFEAIKGRTVLDIRYKPFNRKEAGNYIFHPYLLKEYRNRWFVTGRKEGRDSPTVLALDRIEKIRPLGRDFISNDLFDPDTYYDHVIGVTLVKDASPEKVRVKVQRELVPYVLTKPVHASQQVEKTAVNGDITLTLLVVNNYELRSHLLGLGPMLKVLSPASLRAEMKRLFQQGMDQYK